MILKKEMPHKIPWLENLKLMKNLGSLNYFLSQSILSHKVIILSKKHMP